MTLPKSWNDITLEQYADIYDVTQQQPPDTTDPHERAILEAEQRCKLLAIVTGESFDALLNTPTITVKERYQAISFISQPPSDKPVQEFELGGYTWHVQYDISKLSAANYIDISEYTREPENIIHNAPQIMGLFCTPHKSVTVKKNWIQKSTKLEKVELSTNEKAEILKDCPVSVAYPLTVFFCNLLNSLTSDMEGYLNQVLSTTNNQLKELQAEVISMNDADGL